MKGYSPGKLLFGRDMILPIRHKVDWELIRHQNKTQSNEDNTHKNRNRVDHNYKIVDKIVPTNHNAHKYETPHNFPFAITWCFNNNTINIQYSLIKIRHNIHCIMPYEYDTNIGDIKPKNMCDDINILSPGIYFCIK